MGAGRERAPAADTLERSRSGCTRSRSRCWTVGVICGAIWAESAWGRYWGWDPKEIWSFITWVVYAGYLHARATPSVRTTAPADVASRSPGWSALMFNQFVRRPDFFAGGLHSYAGNEAFG